MKQGWKIKKLGEVFDLQMGKTPSRDNSDYWGDTNVWVAISDLQDKYIGDSKEYITDKALTETKIKKVKAGTTIMSFKLSVGRAAITTKDLYTNEAIMAFNLNDGYNLIADYIYYYLKGYKWQGANKAVMGITLNKASISQNHIVIPPLAEQEKIVAELDCLSGVIEKKKQQLKELDALAESIFYTMFGDPITNEKGWDVVAFESVCNGMTKGPFGSDIKKSLYVPQTEDAYKVYIQANAIEKDLSLGTYYISKDYYDEKMYRFEVYPYDYLITCDGTLGKFVRLPENIEKGIISSSLLRLSIDEDKIKPKYFEYIWSFYMLPSLVKDVRNTALKHLPSVAKIGALKIPRPQIESMRLFEKRIIAIEKQKGLIKESIKEAEELFNSRMDYYFG